MAIRKRKPTSAGRRFQTTSDFAEITQTSPEKSLLVKQSSTGGRNNHGRKTARHRGGGHKRRYRVIDFRRTRTAFPPPLPRSSTTRTATAASRCSTTATARSATSSPPRASRSAPPCSRAPVPTFGRAMPCRCGSSPSVPRSTTSSSSRAPGPRWPARPGRACSSWRRKATPPPCVSPPPRCAVSRSTASPRSVRSATAEAELIKVGKAGRCPLEGQAPPDPWRCHEPGRPPARWRRGQDLGWSPPGVPVGSARRPHP